MDVWLALVSIEGEAMVRSLCGGLGLGGRSRIQGIQVTAYPVPV